MGSFLDGGAPADIHFSGLLVGCRLHGSTLDEDVNWSALGFYRQAVWDPFNAVRIGEARNPGPGCADGNLRICVTNVGSILNKMDHVFNLPAHVVCLSIRVVQGQCRKAGVRAIFGHPVEPEAIHAHCSSDYRGINAGCAVFSKIPARPYSINENLSSFTTGQLSAGIIRLGHFDVILVTIYGVPSSKGSSANQETLRQAFDIISSSPLPSLVVGDFNEPPQGIATVCPFLHLGFIEIFDWCGKTLGKKPPPTCKTLPITILCWFTRC